MDRHGERLRRWEVSFPISLRVAEFVSGLNFRLGLRPRMSTRLGIVGFLGCGATVVMLAGLLALSL